jgi:hypothetical protein
MRQKSKKAPTNSSNNSVVHERNKLDQHRIVILRNGIPSASSWFEHHEMAVHHAYRATLYGAHGLPVGIFKISAVAHEVL